MTRITPSRDVAAELPGAVEFTEKASKLCTVSIAHTDCTYEEASAVFDAGAIVQQGTHEALLESCPVYQEIYYSQFPKEAAENG